MRIEDKFLDKLTFYRIKQTIFNHEDTPWRFIKDVSGLGKAVSYTHLTLPTKA